MQSPKQNKKEPSEVRAKMEYSCFCLILLIQGAQLYLVAETAATTPTGFFPQQNMSDQTNQLMIKSLLRLHGDTTYKGSYGPNGTNPRTFNESGTYPCKYKPMARALNCDHRTGIFTGILLCYCITYNEDLDAIELGLCELNCSPPTHAPVDSVYHKIPTSKNEWNDAICGPYNRSGTLCGKCQDGLYQQAYSYDLQCIECSGDRYNWWKYLLLAYLPLTLFYLVIMALKINIPLSKLQGFVLCSQLVSSSQIARLYLSFSDKNRIIKWSAKIIGIWFGIWNLDFLRLFKYNVCFSTSSLPILALNLAIAVYPLLLMIITYKVLNITHRQQKKACSRFRYLFQIFDKILRIFGKTNRSTVDAFATCMFLSHSKFLTACADLLIPVTVYRLNATHTSSETRLYYDATIEYFGKEHLPYAILASLTLIVLVLVPTMMLLLYSSTPYQKCLNLLPVRWQILIHTFTDSYQGCYKNGTEHGTRDCRWFSAVPFLLQIAMMVGYSVFILSTSISCIMGLLVIVTIFTLLMDPYKKDMNNPFAFFILLFACIVGAANGINVAAMLQNHIVEDIAIFLVIFFFIVVTFVSLGVTLKCIFEH